MAQVANTFDTYDATGNRESLANVIANISPTDTPFMTMCATGRAKSIKEEWQTDELGSAVTTNAVIDGDDATLDATSSTTRVFNFTQISDKTVVISGSQEAVDKAGRKSEIAYQVAKKGSFCPLAA